MAVGLTTPLLPSYPFYLGGLGVTTGPTETGEFSGCVPETVTLDGFTFPVELSLWQSGAVDTFRDSVVATDQPNDTLFNAKGAWARYAYSWHHGCGQSLRDLDDTADPFRHLDSSQVQWWTKYALTLGHITSNARTVASATPVLCQSGIYVFLSDGTTLYRTPDLIIWTAMTAPGGSVQAMTTDGTDLYVATTTGVVKYVGTGTTPTAFGTPIATSTENIAFCSGRLLCGQANVLKEIAAAGTLTTIKTHFQAAFRWTTIFNIGSRIYTGGYAGSRSEIHTLTVDSAGALVVSQEAAPLPMGEKLNFGLSYSGECVLCTSSGLRFAQISGDGTLTYGPLIADFGDVRCATADGRYVFAGWSSMSGRSGVGRLVVDDEVAPLQPAYCTDVSTATTGIVVGVARLNGLTCFALASSGAWVEQSTYETQGYLNSGKIVFGTVEEKALISLSASFSPLLAGQSIIVAVTDENGAMINSGVQNTLDASTLEVDLNGEQVKGASVKVTLLGSGANTPTFYHWRLRSYPISPPVLQWTLPLIAKSQVVVNTGEGHERGMRMEDVHLWVEDLYASRRMCVLRIATRNYLVRCNNFQWRPQSWDTAGEGPQGVLVVELIAAA